jgi:hypothetical protein
MKSTAGEIIVAMFIAGAGAVFAAAAGFAGGIWLCALVFSGEATESALVVGPAAAIVFAAVVFILIFRKMTTYGESPDGQP